MQKTKGFTIIELIVVVAIIAVLSAIVAINVTSYISKSKDAAIKENLGNMQAASAALAGAGSDYSTVCTDVVYGGGAAYTAAGVQSGTTACYDETTKWCACAKLKATGYYCVSDVTKKETAIDCTESGTYCSTTGTGACP